MAFINLDHNATSPLLPEAAEAMRSAPEGNPASAHTVGRRARRVIEDARERIAAILGAQPDEVIFTSGATEANNLAIFGLTGGGGINRSIVASDLEHPCVIEPLKQLEARGAAIDWRPVDARGRFVAGVSDPGPGSTGASDPGTRLVCLMLANHETGAIQPVREVAGALSPGAALHCDAAQAVGKIPVNFHELGVTTLAVSAHKFGGPVGVGALIVKRGTILRPLVFGGHQQHGRRPGTEPVALVAGMAAALETMTRDLAANHQRLTALRAHLWHELNERAAPVVLNGPEIGAADVVATTLNVSFPGCRGDVLLMALDLAGVTCSTGSACSSGSLLPSPVLRAMGISDETLRSALRFSFRPDASIVELTEAAARVSSAVKTARDSSQPLP
jgi:cysteine desulfurase